MEKGHMDDSDPTNWRVQPLVRDANCTKPGSTLPRKMPSEVGVNSSLIMEFLDGAAQRSVDLHSIIIARHGYVVAEGYWKPYANYFRHEMHSLTKSVTATAVGLAISEGYFDLTDRVVLFFPSYVDADNITENLGDMTVEDLLTMRTGQEDSVSGSVWRKIKSSWIDEFFKIPVTHKPGTKFLYTSAAAHMLSAIVNVTTGQTTEQFLQPRLFTPLVICDYEWDTSPEGVNTGANGLRWRTTDSIKLAMLYANNGSWNGKQILPKEWVLAAQKPRPPKNYYGYQFWIEEGKAFYADGLFSQKAMIFPQYNATLAVTAGQHPSEKFYDYIFKYFPKVFESQRTENLVSHDHRLLAYLNSREAYPTFPSVRSLVQRTIDGAMFTFEENEDNLTFAMFNFLAGEQFKFTLEDHRGRHEIMGGIGHPVMSTTSVTVQKLHHKYQPKSMIVETSGGWSDQRTFEMRWIFVESAWTDFVVCHFIGPHLQFYRRVNVNSDGQTYRPMAEARNENWL